MLAHPAMVDESQAVTRCAPLSVEAMRMRASIEARLFDAAAPPVEVGRFVVLDRIGQGGMGTVYRARDPRLDRVVALKLLRPGRGASARRLEREAHAMARLAHPHVVTVYEVGDSPNGVFVAMELVDGDTLASWCTARPLGDRNRWRELLALALQAADGLAAAHAIGLVHRDVKPSNLLIGRDGRLRVADFGLVALDDDESIDGGTTSGGAGSSGSLTLAGDVVGTPAYMAPEQIDGRSDRKSDQFGFCATFFKAFTGTRAYAGDDLDALRESFARGPIAVEPGHLPVAILAVLRRGLSVDPARRFADMPALIDALGRAGRRSRRPWIVAGLGGVAFGVLALRIAAPEPCTREAVGAAWDDARRESVRASIGASTLHSAPATLDRVEQALALRAASWTEQRLASCELARSSDPRAKTAGERMHVCLEQSRASFDTVTAELAIADDDVMLRAVGLTDLLADLGDCASASERGIADDDARDVVDALHRGRIALELAQLERAEAAFRDALAGAEALPRLRSEAHARLAELHDTREHAEAAREHAERALDDAEQLGDRDVLVRRWIALATVVDRHGGSLDVAQFMLTRARRLGQEAALDEGTLALLDLQEGGVLQRHEQWSDAAPFLARAAERFVSNRQPFRAAQAHLQLGECLAMAGDLAAGIAAIEVAVGELEQHLGPDHPEVAYFGFILAQTHGFALDYAAERPLLDRAIEVFEQHPDFQPSLRSGAWLTRASIATAQERWADALLDIDRALALLRALGSDARLIGDALRDRARALRRLARADEALAAVDEAIATEPAAGEHTQLHNAWIRAEVLLDLGRDADAAAEIDHVEPLRARLPPESRSAVQAAEDTARILTRLHRRDDARALLEQALPHAVGGLSSWRPRLERQMAATMAATDATAR